ncbi:hypothetical protein BASA60_009462 [Batrachochytrium salamandrivorans]|nr:hypothetical protein BASA60_009462 [Batrachochytrium salamandrivorans]
MKPISFVAISFLAITVSAWSPWDSPYQNLPTSPSTTTQSEQPPQSTATQSPQHSGQDKVEAELARLTAVYQKEKKIVAPIEAKYNINKQNAIDVGGRMKSIAAKLEETDIDDDEKLKLEKKYREAKAEWVVLATKYNKYYRYYIKIRKKRCNAKIALELLLENQKRITDYNSKNDVKTGPSSNSCYNLVFLREQIDHIPKEIRDLLAEWERIKDDKDRSEDNLKTLRAEYKDGIQRREKQYEIVKEISQEQKHSRPIAKTGVEETVDFGSFENSDILDQDFSWNQIAAALLQMSPRKAPGDDGITTAFYQAALYMPANTQEGVPPTPFARALLRKDGDPLNPGDKRGIALINVGLKLVCKVLQMRIERFVETNNLLSYEQAGFRKREECVGQVVSLVDIIQRRQNAGLNTHVLFIDIRKAFDTVPVGALLWKLQNMGFPRRTLAFLKALYTSSSARARAGSLLSDPFPVQRGFPGLPRDTNPIRGLMYADDVAVFADSEQSLLAASTAIEQWANQWEMQFGVAKCGIISFTGHLAPRLDNPLDIRLHGQLVSRVESYKYLGVLIDSKLDHSAWLKQKRSALEHTISALHPVLANHQLTVNYRSRIFSAVVMGKAYYGLELVGGNKSHLAPLQTTINKGIRLFTGARLSTAIGPLLVETGIGSLLTRSLVSRVRLLERSVTKRTPINAICSGTDNDVFTLNVQGQLVRSQRWFWSRRTKQLYRNRYWLTPQVRPKTVKQRHSFALMETLRTCGDSASLQKYLMLARMDALWTARKAIQIGILVDTHPFSVDHCILCDQQLLSTSIAHLVVECEQVTGHRIQSGLVPAIQKSRLRLLGRALDPGVENVYTWLRGGVLNGEADLDQRWLDGTVEHESMGTRHDNRALAARLADFLQVAYRQYQSTLWKYHRDRLVEVG